ncbi:MAG: hypothetical protein Q7R95_10325 [bacterium]|nr:hypothetical protein [bacterium]
MKKNFIIFFSLVLLFVIGYVGYQIFSLVTPFNKCKDGWIEFGSINTLNVPFTYSACVKQFIIIKVDIYKPVDEVIKVLQKYGTFHDNIKYNLEYEHQNSIKMMSLNQTFKKDTYFHYYHMTLKVKSGLEIETINKINKEAGYNAELYVQRKSMRL